MTNTTLVMIPVPPEEAKARMVRARQEAKAAAKQITGLTKYAPNNKRTAKKIAELTAVWDLNGRIAIGCKVALGYWENLVATADGAGSTQTGQYDAPVPESTGSTASPSQSPYTVVNYVTDHELVSVDEEGG